jgi:hypothetical protein
MRAFVPTEQQPRQSLYQVTDTPHRTTVDPLTKDLGAESMNPTENGSLEHRSFGLHNVHLPKLQEVDVIVYDSVQQTVRRGQHLENVLSLLRLSEESREDISTTTV